MSLLASTQIGVFRALHRVLGFAGFGTASYRPPERRPDFASVRRVANDRQLLLTPLEGVQIISAVRATAKLAGCMAEVGVYQGASARIIREADRCRPMHLFDTFSGLPPTAPTDTEFRAGTLQPFTPGEFACSLDDVHAYLSDLPDITYHVGLFPDSAVHLTDLRFSFVHLDVDLYESTSRSVAWFYERMVPGGIIMSHDFVTCAGPRRALTEFFASKPEPLIELAGNQALIVKI